MLIEESLARGLKWVVFEANNDALWARVRLAVGDFMHNLFRQGAFKGVTALQSYFVKCDAETTSRADIDAGYFNLVVGFAPSRPSEFVTVAVQQVAGQAAP